MRCLRIFYYHNSSSKGWNQVESAKAQGGCLANKYTHISGNGTNMGEIKSITRITFSGVATTSRPDAGQKSKSQSGPENNVLVTTDFLSSCEVGMGIRLINTSLSGRHRWQSSPLQKRRPKRNSLSLTILNGMDDKIPISVISPPDASVPGSSLCKVISDTSFFGSGATEPRIISL